MTHRVLVCGSRDYSDRDRLNKVLDKLHKKHGDSLMIISGGAVGADELARQWAFSRKVDHLILYAKWDTHKKAAGPIRNARMLKVGKPHEVVAFSNDFEHSKGTKDMVAKAEKAKVKVKKYA